MQKRKTTVGYVYNKYPERARLCCDSQSNHECQLDYNQPHYRHPAAGCGMIHTRVKDTEPNHGGLHKVDHQNSREQCDTTAKKAVTLKYFLGTF